MKRTTTTILSGLLAFLLFTVFAAAARAQGSPEAGVEVALRTGVAVPFGDIQDGSALDRQVSSAIPLVVEGGYRFDENIFAGLRFQYGFPQLKNPNGGCSGNLSCDGSVVTLALEGLYRFQPAATFAPWLGVGAGYEWASEDVNGPNVAGGGTNRGLMALVQGGGDIRVAPKLVLGPFIEASFGRYDNASARVQLGNNVIESDADISNTAWHTWIALGVRGAFGI